MSRRDALRAEIDEWRARFRERHGRDVARADVESDAKMRATFREYRALGELRNVQNRRADVTTTGDAGREDAPKARTKTLEELRRAMTSTEVETEGEAIEATPIKAPRDDRGADARKAMESTPRRSPRIARMKKESENVDGLSFGIGSKTRAVNRALFGGQPKKAGASFAEVKRKRDDVVAKDGVQALSESAIRAVESLGETRGPIANDTTKLLRVEEGKGRKKRAATDGSRAPAPKKVASTSDAVEPKAKTAADIRAEHAARIADEKAASRRGNFKKFNPKGTWKQKVKNGARKKAANHYRYGGGRRAANKAEDRAERDPNATESAEPPSVWAGGDWCEPPPSTLVENAVEDGLTPAKRALRAREKADGLAREYITAEAAASAKAEAERRAKLQVGPELEAAIQRAKSDPNKENLTEVLIRGFGHDNFRSGQLEIITRILRGENTLALLPTGAGKSLTYQLPAMLISGLTIVISPLLALMADQMDSLPPSLPGGALRSDMDRNDMWETLTRLRAGKIKVLFVSPERLLNDNFINDLQDVPGGVSLACVDEAHCVSEWSHNFRPAYHRLGRILNDRVRAKTTLALTATATKKTELSLIRQLNIPNEGVLRNVRVRDNLILSVMRVPEKLREKTLVYMLKHDELLQTGSIIVYTATQRDSERVAAFLYNEGVKAKAYHAGQEPAQRRQTQAEFMGSRVRVVVATIAFGMGLDKSDVRAVINFSLPRSPEAYIQQAGRAGRDGAPAACITFLDTSDYLRSRSLTFSDGVDRPSIAKLLQFVLQSGPILKKAAHEGDWTPCVGALSASEMEIKIDMRIEAIETVLSCLDLWGEGIIDIRSQDASVVNELDPAHAKGLIRILPDIRATCEAEFFERPPKAIGEDCPLAAAIDKLVPKPKGSMYKFKIVDACTHMQCGFDEVSAQLKALAKHDNVRYTLSDRAVGFEIVRAPPKDIQPLAKALADHCADIEACSVGKLDALYNAMDEAANAESDEAQGEHLRQRLAEYLNEDSDMVPSPPACVKTESNLLLVDIKVLLAHRSGGKNGGAGMMTARAVARILHKLHSPAYPAKEWGRHHAWGRHADVDFKHILARAEEEIAKARKIA